MDRSPKAGSLVNLWLIAMGLVVVALTRLIGASAIVAVVASIVLAVAVVVRASLSTLARAYIAYIVLGLVVAPRFSINPIVNLDRTQFLGSLWIIAVCLGATVSARAKHSARWVRHGPPEQRATPAVCIAIVSLLAEYMLVSRGSFGVAGQYATGNSGGGYLGLLVQVGPPSAAGALLATLARPARMPSDIVLPAALVALQAVALSFSGFRGAAPLYVLSVALCSVHPAGPRRRTPLGRRVLVGAALLGFIGMLFLHGASVRQSAATAAGQAGATISVSNALPTVVRRFDESPYLARADEARHEPAAREAVFMGNQLAAVLPRFLYPSKPTVDYGKEVSIAVYGATTDTRNSSTVTTFGDAIINFGLAGGMILIAIYIFLVDSVFRRMRSAATVRSLSVRVALVTAALNLEAPVGLNLVGMLRVSIAIVVSQWLVALAFSPLAARRGAEAAR